MRILAFAALWWIVSDGRGDWAFGIPVVGLAALVSYRLQPRRGTRLRALALLRFSGFFLFESLRAGIDVARRALSPGLRLAPAFFDYPLRLPEGPARVFLVDTLSLLPGTLGVDLRKGVARLHVLDAGLPLESEVRTVERHVAAVFGVELSTQPDDAQWKRCTSR